MGILQSKEEKLYLEVNYGNIEGIKTLHKDGAGLEWIDRKGKSPLIIACGSPHLLPVAKLLIELGANINNYHSGRHVGTPLHHAARNGLVQTVNLLLSYGANPLATNDYLQTPLDIARAKGHCNVVRAIESHICIFSGWMREELALKSVLQTKIWAVVLPCNLKSTFELAIYPDVQVSKPRAVISLSDVIIEDPKFDQHDPAMIIVDNSSTRKTRFSRRACRRRRRQEWRCARQSTLNIARHDGKDSFPVATQYKFLSAHEGDKCQLQMFYDACRGNILKNKIYSPEEDRELLMNINTSIQATIAENKEENVVSEIKEEDNNIDIASSSESSCAICLDARVEAACIPCGHMSGCIPCLNEIQDKELGCPVCRAKIETVVRIYSV